ncbi:type VII secretion protein EssC [uncultured Thomasclavelia sp.]|uniref:type VII secretion protein EssC n=1 Tax=uncultured Thomasclavelia sp. TaxID=3025759 RepID=UPI002605233F|nr:type VII secretion protein EssC [uncultured Thomasclavelia sp.]
MILLLLRNDYLSSMNLPDKVQGQFWLKDKGCDLNEEVVAVEGYNGEWLLKSNNNYRLCNGEDRVILKKNVIYKLENYRKEILFVFLEGKEYHVPFMKYRIPYKECCFSVGRKEDNIIVVNNPSISRHHFNLIYANGAWEITDLNSTNGTFVNQRKIEYAKLKVGDVIYAMGLKIIIGIDFIAMNINSNISICSGSLIPVVADQLTIMNDKKAIRAYELFNRFPRRRYAIKENEINIESPPVSLNGNQIPVLLRMGGSMAMGGRSLMSGNVLSVLSLLVFPMLNTKYSEKQKKEYEAKRKIKYREYLEKKETEILKEKAEEENNLNYNYPSALEVLNFADENKKRLWERRNIDDDFLNLRIGIGNIPLLAKYNYQKERFDLEDDELENEMYNLVHKEILLEDVPIMNSFKEDYISGVLGDKSLLLMFVQRLIIQIVMTHSYDEVKIMVLMDEHDLENEEMKKYQLEYLPHLWNNQKTMRFIATNSSEAFQLGEFLKREIENDLKKPRGLSQILKDRPYYFIIGLHKKIFDSMGILKDIMQVESNIGVSIIAAFEDLPKECTKIFQTNTMLSNQIIHIKDLDKKNIYFKLDDVNLDLVKNAMKKIANTHLKIVREVFTLPKMYTFLEMFDVGRVEHLNSIQRWQENNPVNSLATPVGIGTDGTAFELDLHQKYQGPHGLIAGMTGSGKSEFIMTYILSLAINYHPHEVAFLLIDYKGGGLAGAFEDRERGIHLPHLVGTITNLDGNMIQRSLMSIQSELIRRQEFFNEVKKQTGEASIDIYSYQSLYRRKIVTKPLPHLFIIADEFAELKQQEPEFMDQLISAARIGRSLGIHLILATQKPSGIVNDQIRSNTKFRVCLKVQEKADSMDMLKRGEAAELKDTGRFYLQVGYNEYFAMGQSAWAGANYQPQDKVIHEKDNRVQFIDHLGQTVIEVKEHTKKKERNKSQLSAVVSYLSDLARKEHIVTPRIFIDPLEKQIDIHALPFEKKENEISIPLGIVDNPGKQYQSLFEYNLLNGNHLMIAGDNRSGKTTLIQTMLYLLTKNYTTSDINFYILDYSSRLLNIFEPLPHCGEILTDEDEMQLSSFFKLIQEILEDRKKLFKSLGVDSFEIARKIKKLPVILVIIDNFAGLRASKTGENYIYRLPELLKACVNYGIKFIISINHINEVALKIKQELIDRITFHLKDKYEYGDALGSRCSYLPPEIQGRGMICFQEEVLEWQAGIYMPGKDEEERLSCLKNEIMEIAKTCQNESKARLFIKIPEDEEYESFAEQFEVGRIPLGYLLTDVKPIALPFRQFSKLAIYFGNKKGKEKILKQFLYIAYKENMDIKIVKHKDSIFDLNSHLLGFVSQTDRIDMYEEEDKDLMDLFQQLAPELINRKKILEDFCQKNNLDFNSLDIVKKSFDYMQTKCRPIFILIENFADLAKNINQDILKGFRAYFQVARRYNIYFIGCFYPEDGKHITSDVFFEDFFEEKMCLLFGGNYDKQVLISNLSREYYQINKEIQFNKCIMQYRNGIYALQMPCGSLKEEILHKDELSIFE